MIQRGEKQEENLSSTVRSAAISLLCKMNPSQALSIRSKCVEFCRMPALAIMLSLDTNVYGNLDSDGDMVAFVSGLLLGNDQTIRFVLTLTNTMELIILQFFVYLFLRNWFALFIRTGQKRKGEMSSTALQLLRDDLLKRLQHIITHSQDDNLPDGLVVQASALLRLYCALRGIAGIK